MKINALESKLKKTNPLFEDKLLLFKDGISDLVFNARYRMKLTQHELAQRLRTKQPGIARWESGTQLPGLDFLYRLAEIAGAQLHVAFEYPKELNLKQTTSFALSASKAREAQPARYVGFSFSTNTRQVFHGR